MSIIVDRSIFDGYHNLFSNKKQVTNPSSDERDQIRNLPAGQAGILDENVAIRQVSFQNPNPFDLLKRESQLALIYDQMKNFEQEFREAAKEKLEQLKKVFEEMEAQLAEGKKEAQEAFEREKDSFQSYVDEQREKFKAERSRSVTLRQQLLARLQALQAALEVDAPEDSEMYALYREKLLQEIYGLEGTMREAYEIMRFRLREQLDQFKAKLDAFRIQLALGDFEKREQATPQREDLKVAIKATVNLFKEEEKRGDKLDTFTEEISASFEHLRRAFVELFS